MIKYDFKFNHTFFYEKTTPLPLNTHNHPFIPTLLQKTPHADQRGREMVDLGCSRVLYLIRSAFRKPYIVRIWWMMILSDEALSYVVRVMDWV